MLDFHDYNVRVWSDGGVDINLHDHLQYSEHGGGYGIQCNADDDTREYNAMLIRSKMAAKAMRELDKTLPVDPND